LASIHSYAENEFVADLTSQTEKYYLGGYRSEGDPNQWSWSDETEWGAYTGWGPGQPDKSQETKLSLFHNNIYDWSDTYGDRSLKAIYKIPL